jgi:N-glycosylase/DNA lyase
MKFNSLIDLKLTQESGQTSQPPWKVIGDNYSDIVFIKGIPILVNAFQEDITSLSIDYEFPLADGYNKFDNFSDTYEKDLREDIKNEVSRIFDLNFDLAKFYNYLSEDPKLEPSAEFCRGLRLFLAKNVFESFISSIASANNSILRWTKSISKIREKWGTPVKFPSGIFYSFPSPKILTSVYEDDLEEYEACGRSIEIECCVKNLKACGVGYRAPYMKKTSELLELEIDLFEIPNMKYEEAFETVLTLPGVGPKVADCILLYGYGFREAFPSDVWIKRIISHLYFSDKDLSVDKVRDFGMERFGEYAGYAQLYLFHYARKSGLINKLKN